MWISVNSISVWMVILYGVSESSIASKTWTCLKLMVSAMVLLEPGQSFDLTGRIWDDIEPEPRARWDMGTVIAEGMNSHT